MTPKQIKSLLATIDLPVLHLTLHRKWFDMIAKGEKTEEYRAMKPYYRSRFRCAQPVSDRVAQHKGIEPGMYVTHINIGGWQCHPSEVLILFSNGYARDARKMLCRIGSVRVGKGKAEWGADPSESCYIISIVNATPLNFTI